jgi:hypothetical protein
VSVFLCLALLPRLTISADWACYQGDPQHTGLSTAQVDVSNLILVWSAPKSPTGYSTPLIVGHTVYATQNGAGEGVPSTISSFELETGAINWSYTGNFTFPSQAAVGGGFVVFVGATTPSSPSALYVLDAATGFLLYTVPVREGLDCVMPTVVHDSATGNTVAFITDGNLLSAVSLGPSSGSVLWTQGGTFGGQSMPTVVGNSVVIAAPCQYFAFDQSTGAMNHFFSGDCNGGGGSTVAYDAARSQFYVLADYTGIGAALSAYHYTDNNNITLAWQRRGAGLGSVAIGSTGNVYSVGSTVIWELDPNTGATLRSISGSFARGVTPALTNGFIWAFSDQSSGTSAQTYIFDLNTLQLVKTLPGSRGSFNSPYDSPGAICNNHFLLDYGTFYSSPGFDVYAAPGPVRLQTAVSRMTHGSAGIFDVSLPLIGNPGIECRRGGSNNSYTLIFSFDESLISVDAANVSNGTGLVTTGRIDSDDTHNYIVNLTGVSNAQFITVTLNNVTDSVGGFSSAVSVPMGVLLGDVNASGRVDGNDVSAVQSHTREPVDNTNFRCDVNASGRIDGNDVSLTRAQTRTTLQ